MCHELDTQSIRISRYIKWELAKMAAICERLESILLDSLRIDASVFCLVENNKRGFSSFHTHKRKLPFGPTHLLYPDDRNRTS